MRDLTVRAGTRRHSTGSPTVFAGVIAGIVLATVVLTPLLHQFLPFSFERIFTRVLMVSALVGTFILGGFRSERLRRFGLAWSDRSWRSAATGALLAFALLTAYAGACIIAGHGEWAVRDRTAWRWVEAVAGAVATAVLIALAEEFLFRGFVFTSLRDLVFRRRVWPAMAATSAAYSLIHFISVSKPAIGPDPGLSESLQLALAPVRSLGAWETAWPSAIGLFLFGMVLNACAARTRSLYPSVGLHAGSVLFLRLVKSFVKFPPVRSPFWGTSLVYDGAAGWVLMIAMGIVSCQVFPPEERLHEDPAPAIPSSR